MTITRTLKALSLIACAATLLAGCNGSSNPNAKKIGIIVPIQHKAMDAIVAGFEDTLRATSPYPLEFKVSNAQGDMNLERAIIQQMRDEHEDIVVPIGTDATEMTAATVQQQPIVSLAASYSQAQRDKRQPCNIAVVHDEISADLLVKFVHATYPNVTRLVLVHSAADKVFPEVQATIAASKQYGLQIKTMMAPTLSDLYSVANAIPANTQGILVLKDNLIVNGISTLETAAEKRHIPLITSDEGSVESGAAFALGVHEKEIGVAGAELAAQVLNGKAACSLPIVEMTKLTVFVNQATLTKEGQSLQPIVDAAKQLNYKVEMVGQG